MVTTGVDGHLDQPTDALVPWEGLCSPWKEGPWGGSLLGLRRSEGVVSGSKQGRDLEWWIGDEWTDRGMDRSA